MQSPVRRLWFVLSSCVALAVPGCVADNTDCGGPTSDWPFCGRGGPSPSITGGGARGEDGSTGDSNLDSGGSGSFMPPMGAGGENAGGGDAGSTGGAVSANGGGAADDACLLCLDLDGSLSGFVEGEFAPPELGCGMPLPCADEAELDGGDQKSLEGTAPFDFEHGSVTWQSDAPGYVDVFLRAEDVEGDEVRIALRFDESELAAADGPVATGVVQAVDCGGDALAPMRASLLLQSLGWDAGFHGLITLEGDGWMAEVDLVAQGVCAP